MSTPASPNRPSLDLPTDGPSMGGNATVTRDACPPTLDGPAMDPGLTTIQPGGGVVMSIELFWGRLRRWYLRRFRKGFVRRMTESRQGNRGSIPFDPVDSRDIKYYRNQDTHWWAETDDPFAWRDGLPFVRVGLAELILIGGGCLVLAVVLGAIWWPLAPVMLTLAGGVAWFFRDPSREIPVETGTIVSPADGKLVEIQRVVDPELGPSVQFGIFLSLFNVHANRASLPGRVVAVRYRPGKFMNALRPESARENENLDVILGDVEAIGGGSVASEANAIEVFGGQLVQDEPAVLPGMIRIRQITGQFARRIVCWVRPGDVLSRGEMFGMIKLGSRTELVVPDNPSLEIVAKVGDKVRAGSTALGRYRYRMADRSGDNGNS